jgi:hypothetical protein
MEDDLIVKYYSEKQYFELLQHIKNNEIPKMQEYHTTEYYASCISEIYLFSLLRNSEEIKFMHNNLNFKRVYSYFSDEKNHRKLYKNDTILDFGMYKYDTILDIANIDPGYIFWCIENIADFYVTPQILMNIILSNDKLPLTTVELNILKSDCINLYHRYGYIKERLIIPWKIEIEHLKTYYNKSKEIIQKYEDDINELDNAEGINEDDYNNYQNYINSKYDNEIKYFKFLNRILFLYHKHGNADYRYY